MGPQKFIAANTTEALKLVRQQVGGDAMVLSTRDTPQGVEIVAISPEALSSLSQRKDAGGFGEAFNNGTTDASFTAPTPSPTYAPSSVPTAAADAPTAPQVEKLLAEFSAVKQLLQTHLSKLRRLYRCNNLLQKLRLVHN
jgi:flagellar biosynthesis protein FlhF